MIPKEKLTKEFLQAYADEQTRKYLSTDPINEKVAEQHLSKAYEVAGLKPPKNFIWYDSPIQWVSVGDSVGDSGKLNEDYKPENPIDRDEARQQIKSLFLDKVGKDNEKDTANHGQCNSACHAISENIVKTELRKKIKEL